MCRENIMGQPLPQPILFDSVPRRNLCCPQHRPKKSPALNMAAISGHGFRFWCPTSRKLSYRCLSRQRQWQLRYSQRREWKRYGPIAQTIRNAAVKRKARSSG